MPCAIAQYTLQIFYIFCHLLRLIVQSHIKKKTKNYTNDAIIEKQSAVPTTGKIHIRDRLIQMHQVQITTLTGNKGKNYNMLHTNRSTRNWFPTTCHNQYFQKYYKFAQGTWVMLPDDCIWLSFNITIDDRFCLWGSAPPTSNAYFSTKRKPGVVFLVPATFPFQPTTIRNKFENTICIYDSKVTVQRQLCSAVHFSAIPAE